MKKNKRMALVLFATTVIAVVLVLSSCQHNTDDEGNVSKPTLATKVENVINSLNTVINSTDDENVKRTAQKVTESATAVKKQIPSLQTSHTASDLLIESLEGLITKFQTWSENITILAQKETLSDDEKSTLRSIEAQAVTYTTAISTSGTESDITNAISTADGKISSGKRTALFNLNEHGSNTAPTATIKEDGTLTEPTDPTDNNGFTFGGWHADANCTISWDFSDALAYGETTLYAKWMKVTFNTNSPSLEITVTNSNFSSQIDKDGTLTEPSDPTATGDFVFGGWYKDKTFTNLSVWNFASDKLSNGETTLYAKWMKATFNLNGYGSSTTLNATIAKNGKLTEPKTPTDTNGWHFAGWFTKNDLTSSSAWSFTDTLSYGETTLYAKWVKVNFDMNGHGNSLQPELTFAGKGDILPPFANKGYEPDPQIESDNTYLFGGWYKDKECTDAQRWNFTDHVPEHGKETTLYAKWRVLTETLESLPDDALAQDYSGTVWFIAVGQAFGPSTEKAIITKSKTGDGKFVSVKMPGGQGKGTMNMGGYIVPNVLVTKDGEKYKLSKGFFDVPNERKRTDGTTMMMTGKLLNGTLEKVNGTWKLKLSAEAMPGNMPLRVETMFQQK